MTGEDCTNLWCQVTSQKPGDFTELISIASVTKLYSMQQVQFVSSQM